MPFLPNVMRAHRKVMETVEAVASSEDGQTEAKRIRLLVAPDAGEASKCEQLDGGSTEQTTSIFLYSADGNLVPAEIVVDSLNDNIIAVPVENSVLKKEKVTRVLEAPKILRTTEIQGLGPKKTTKSQNITLLQSRPQSSNTRTKCVIPSILQAKPKHPLQNTVTKNIVIASHTQNKIPSKPEPISTKILITSDGQAKPQPILSTATLKMPSPVDLHVKAQLSDFIDDRLSLLSDVSEKSGGQGGGGACQTVVMRANSLGELELDPMFVTGEGLIEPEGEEVRLATASDLSPADRLNCSILAGVNKTEDVNIAEEVQVDLQPSAARVKGSSGNVNQNWFTSREDKQMLRWRGHAWRQGMWSKEETDMLQQNIEKYCSDRGLSDPASVIFKMSKEERSGFYRVIAQGLNRPLFSVYRRVIRLYDNRNHIGKYTSDEVTKLRELRMKHGNNWQAIAAHLGRSAASVKDRCRLLNENCNRGVWSPEEEDRLAEVVYNLASALPGEQIQVTSGISWGEVAARVGTRSEKQCRTKWLNYLNWKRTSGVEWSKADDVQLICRLSVCGVQEESQVDWTALARGWPACRSPHWLRGKWWNLKRKLPNASQESSLRELCQQLYNLQSLSLMQSTLVELPATAVNSAAATLTNAGSTTGVGKNLSSVNQDSLATGSVKLCIPAANFSHIINSDDGEEDMAAKLSGLVQTALVVPTSSNCSPQTVTTLVSQPQVLSTASLPTPVTTQLSPHLTSQLTSTITNCSKNQSIVVTTLEDPLGLQLAEVGGTGVDRSTLLNQGLQSVVKEEDLLSDGEGTHTQAGLNTGLDPSSPAVTSQVILNDPILSVSGEPLGCEECLQQDRDDADIVIV
ncbi:cyclin-D-binding Myb-like transcription factor 1 isoform X3 [Penaeus vannamei]|uniref:cyclin-D-binding Myb-like transcription factor 1 isoform X3 n=1 Tax=Penaeus vannamei TaxID=6689 RepID=UPI00387FA8F9